MQTVSGWRRKAEECNRMAFCQKRPRMAAASGTQGGGGRKYAILAALRRDSMTGIRPFRRHPDRRKPAPCGRHHHVRQPFRLTGDNPSLAFRAPPRPVWKRKTARSPLFPRFPHAGKPLCGKKFPSLRQERNFFQQRNSIFAAQKNGTGRRNARILHFSAPFSAVF